MTEDDRDLRLVSLYLEGSLSAAELAEFEQRITEDEAFADSVARCSLTHRQIMELFSESKLHDLLERAIASSPSLPRPLLAELAAGSREKFSATRWSQIDALPWWAWATGALLLSVGLVFWQRPGQPAPRDATPPQVAGRPDAIPQNEWPIAATLTRMEDCQWAANATPFNNGDHLKSGARVALQSGLAKLTFECGAEVVLQGPCDFLVESPMLGFLQSGKITANVPRRAFTFAIRAPGVDFVDLGTDFGISVDEQGLSELHVFEGEVLYRQDEEAKKSSEVVHVTKDKAVKFISSPGQPSMIALDKNQFSRHFDLRRGEDADVSLPVSQNLALWLSADRGVDVDNQGGVVSWHDNMYGDNKVAEDASQANPSERPVLVANALNNMPAVRFDGRNDLLLTTPIETTDNQTVLIVCQFSPEAFSGDRIYGGQILNYDGPPTRELSNTLAPGILQIGEPLLKDEFKPSLITGQVFAGFIGKTTVEAGRVDAEPVGANSPVIIAYHYDYDHRRATLYLNGQNYGEANAFAPAGLTSRKVIGRHAWMELFFGGDLSELMIFNEALPPEDLTAITRHLAERYNIPLASQ